MSLPSLSFNRTGLVPAPSWVMSYVLLFPRTAIHEQSTVPGFLGTRSSSIPLSASPSISLSLRPLRRPFSAGRRAALACSVRASAWDLLPPVVRSSISSWRQNPDTSRPPRLHFWRRRAAPGSSRPPHRPRTDHLKNRHRSWFHPSPYLLTKLLLNQGSFHYRFLYPLSLPNDVLRNIGCFYMFYLTEV